MKTFQQFLIEALNQDSKDDYKAMFDACTFLKSDSFENIIDKIKIIYDELYNQNDCVYTAIGYEAAKRKVHNKVNGRYSLFELCSSWFEAEPDSSAIEYAERKRKLSNGNYMLTFEEDGDISGDPEKAIERICKLSGVKFDSEIANSNEFLDDLYIAF